MKEKHKKININKKKRKFTTESRKEQTKIIVQEMEKYINPQRGTNSGDIVMWM